MSLLPVNETESTIESCQLSLTMFPDSSPSECRAPLVCAYVITYDGKRFLDRCFQTLQDLTDYPNCRLVLVDNGSSDGSGRYVRENFPAVDVLRVFPNIGYAHGANEAIADALRRGAKYVVLMNDDIAILHPQWLREAVSHAERDPSIGIVGFVEATTDNPHRVVLDSSVVNVEYLQSAVMLMPIELFARIGVFDDVYYVVGDEDDLGARAQAAGYRTVRLGIPIYHFGGGTHQNYSRRAAYLQMRNGIRFCLKNRSFLHACLRAVRIIDIACNPWPVSFDPRDVAHWRVRNSGNVFVNALLWLRAVSWNIVRLPQTLRIRAAERRLIRAALAAPKHADAAPRIRAHAPPAGQLSY
jgi:GT2 family glycosyltransferase